MTRKKEVRAPRKIKSTDFNLKEVKPLTEKQKEAFEAWYSNHNMVLHGIAGTGKTFLSMYMGLEEVLGYIEDYPKYDTLVIVRSCVATREIGHLPGTAEEKAKQYELPYYAICTELLGRGDAYEILKHKNVINFISTSFIRGTTLNNCIVIVDEINNMTFHELDSVITRVGKNCKIIFSGDYRQSDLREHDKKGLHDFLTILQEMKMFHYTEFGVTDIVRSELVKEYIIQKTNNGIV